MAKNIPPKKKLSEEIMGELFVAEPARETITTPSPLRVRKTKEAQKERMQLTIQPSMKNALQRYVEDHDLSMNKLILKIVGDFLKNEGYL